MVMPMVYNGFFIWMGIFGMNHIPSVCSLSASNGRVKPTQISDDFPQVFF